MEIIKMSGYTIEEKVEIARQHLLPRQLKEHGLTAKHLTIGSNWKKLIVIPRLVCTWFRSKSARI
jgi:ATP-dependent Lon protease